MKKDALNQLGNIPFTPAILSTLYPDTRHICDKARYLEQEKRIIRMKRGLYVRSSEDGAMQIPFLIANHLYGPSYVSFQSALRHYGLIPERVFETTSMTIKHSRSFDTPLGTFSYRNCGVDYFPIGIRQEQEGSDTYLIATPEKALCDLLLKTKGLNLSNTKKLESFLASDLRFEMDALETFDKDLLEQCRQHTSIKSDLISNLIHLKNNE